MWHYDEKRPPFEVKYKNIAQRWGIDESAVAAIIRRYTELFEEILEKIRRGEQLQLSRYYRDIRRPEEYAYDVVDGWIIEDLVGVVWLPTKVKEINPSVVVTRSGADRSREFVFKGTNRITTEPDFRYTDRHGVERKIELQMARRELKCFDMKESKVERVLREGRIVYLWILLPSDEYFLVDPTVFKSRKPEPNPRWGGKQTYKICIDEVRERRWGPFRMADPIPPTLVNMLNI